ncbi:hypothetical protein [Massilia sp. HP4]|uniref:hypothetical protein n=1 Tax=Massilia sp. HP4 TaxID=2562316 RepID=UPI0010BFF98D|nr:hypothetical protein [Massilia sp. HP4]
MSISYLRVAQPRQFPSEGRRVPEAAYQDAHNEEALDEALAESFPASDPMAVDISTAVPGAGLRHAPARDTPS